MSLLDELNELDPEDTRDIKVAYYQASDGIVKLSRVINSLRCEGDSELYGEKQKVKAIRVILDLMNIGVVL